MVHTSSDMKIGGAYTFSALAEWTQRAQLADGLNALGYGGHVPEPRSATACLKDALSEVFPERGVEIKPLSQQGSFEIIRVRRGEDRNDYEHLHRVSVNDERQVSLKPYVHDTAQKIIEEFNTQLGLLRAGQVTACLVAILKSMGGTSLRPKGGLYWVPPQRVADWAQVAQVVDGSGFRKGSTVYILRHQMDGDALRAIRDGIMHEVQARSSEIRREVLDDEAPLGSRALEHRQQEAADLRDKVKLYEEMLGVGLDSLTQTLDEVETTIGQATLLASATVD